MIPVPKSVLRFLGTILTSFPSIPFLNSFHLSTKQRNNSLIETLKTGRFAAESGLIGILTGYNYIFTSLLNDLPTVSMLQVLDLKGASSNEVMNVRQLGLTETNRTTLGLLVGSGSKSEPTESQRTNHDVGATKTSCYSLVSY